MPPVHSRLVQRRGASGPRAGIEEACQGSGQEGEIGLGRWPGYIPYMMHCTAECTFYSAENSSVSAYQCTRLSVADCRGGPCRTIRRSGHPYHAPALWASVKASSACVQWNMGRHLGTLWPEQLRSFPFHQQARCCMNKYKVGRWR